MLFVNIFFSSIKLFKVFCILKIAACNIVKKRLSFLKKLLAIKNIATKTKDYNQQANMIVDNKVFCIN